MKYSLKILITVIFLSTVVFLAATEKYAVLITGEYADPRADFEGSWALRNLNNRDRMNEFWNDTYLMWELLIESDYADSNIFVFYADSVDYSWLNDIDIRYDPQHNYPDIIEPPDGQITDSTATHSHVKNVLLGLADDVNFQVDVYLRVIVVVAL